MHNTVNKHNSQIHIFLGFSKLQIYAIVNFCIQLWMTFLCFWNYELPMRCNNMLGLFAYASTQYHLHRFLNTTIMPSINFSVVLPTPLPQTCFTFYKFSLAEIKIWRKEVVTFFSHQNFDECERTLRLNVANQVLCHRCPNIMWWRFRKEIF